MNSWTSSCPLFAMHLLRMDGCILDPSNRKVEPRTWWWFKGIYSSNLDHTKKISFYVKCVFTDVCLCVCVCLYPQILSFFFGGGGKCSFKGEISGKETRSNFELLRFFIYSLVKDPTCWLPRSLIHEVIKGDSREPPRTWGIPLW